MQTEFNAKCKLTRKTVFFFGRQKRGNIRFYKIFILRNSPCLRRFFFFGTAEASEISGSIDYYLGSSRERGGPMNP